MARLARAGRPAPAARGNRALTHLTSGRPAVIAVVVAEAGAIVLLGLLVAGLLRSHAEILRRLHELGAGMDDAHLDAELDTAAPLTLSGRLVDVGADTTAYDVVGERLDGANVSLSVPRA